MLSLSIIPIVLPRIIPLNCGLSDISLIEQKTSTCPMRPRLIYIWMCQVVLCVCYQHYAVTLNMTVDNQQIAQYKDTLRGCAGFQCFFYNFTTHQLQYHIEVPTSGNSFCKFTDYLMIQARFHKMWHFQICNISHTGLTAVYSLLKFEDLSTGIKLSTNMTTFGQFVNDQDFPWYYSKAANQMVMPWYYLKTIQRIAFNVKQEKIMLHGFKPGRGYQKSKNASSTTLYSLEGYPDDNLTRSIHSTNLPVNVSQACLVAHGRYIVMVVGEPSICIYNTSSKQIIFRQRVSSWEVELIKLKKVNETHVVVANGGVSPEIRVYDVRIPSAIVTINLNSSAPGTVITPYMHNNTLLYHQSTANSTLHTLTHFPINRQIRVEYIPAQQPQQPVCSEPHQIINNTYCVLCSDQCDQCQPLSTNACTSCTHGFVLRADGSCIVDVRMALVMDAVTGLRMCGLFSFDMGLWELLDDVWLYRFHSLRYEQYAKSTLKITHSFYAHRFLPYSLNRFIPQFLPPHFGSPTHSATSTKYTNYVKSNQNQHRTTIVNAFALGMLLTTLIFAIFYAISKLLNFLKVSLATFFLYATLGLVLINQILGERIGYVGWLFWGEISVPSFTSTSEKVFMTCLIAVFFVMLVYVLTFFPLAGWHYRKKRRSLRIICSLYTNTPATLRYFTIRNSLLLLQTFFHIYLYSSPNLSKILLFVSALLKLGNLVVHYRICKMVMLYFTSLFYQVSLFLFAGIILLDELECPELFEVRIKLVQFIALLMLALFAGLKMVCYAAVGLTAFQPKWIQPLQPASNPRNIQKTKKQRITPATLNRQKRSNKQDDEPRYVKMLKKSDSIIQTNVETRPTLLASFLLFMRMSQITGSTNSTASSFERSNKVSPQLSPQS